MTIILRQNQDDDFEIRFYKEILEQLGQSFRGKKDESQIRQIWFGENKSSGDKEIQVSKVMSDIAR